MPAQSRRPGAHGTGGPSFGLARRSVPPRRQAGPPTGAQSTRGGADPHGVNLHLRDRPGGCPFLFGGPLGWFERVGQRDATRMHVATSS